MTRRDNTKPSNAKLKQRRSKLSEGMIIALVGFVGTIIASLLGSPFVERFFASTSVPVGLTPSAITLTVQSTVQSETPRLSPEPIGISDSTATPSTTEITDARGVQMVFIPSGEFTMGSDDGFPDEKPAHTVTLDAYYIDKYEVTNALYEVCVNAGICKAPQNKSSYTHSNYYGNADFKDHPVIYVNWNMAKTYCEWRGAQLPTEAQWEKAARGADGRVYPWGHSFDGAVINFCDLNCTLEWADKNYDDGYEDVAPVGSYPQGTSPYGVHDMVGNVFEWVADWYSASYYTTTVGRNTVNPQGPSDGQERVMRGPSWYYTKTDMYSSYRTKSDPNDIYYDVGFRCAKGANP